MENARVSLLEISYESNGIKAHGRLFMNDDGKFEFEGDVEESAKVFFDCLESMCNKCIKKWDKIRYPLFSWRETK